MVCRITQGGHNHKNVHLHVMIAAEYKKIFLSVAMKHKTYIFGNTDIHRVSNTLNNSNNNN